MTVTEIIHAIKHSKDFGITVIVENNPCDVEHNLAETFGSIPNSDTDGMLDFIFEIFRIGSNEEKVLAHKALDVEWLAENATEPLNKAVSAIMNEAAKK